MKPLFATTIMAVMLVSGSAAQGTAWWHGSWVNADSPQACDANDSLIIFTATEVSPWETTCAIKLQTDIRDTQGVLLDIACSYPDSPDEGFSDRRIMLELADGNMLSYSRVSKQSTILRRCAGT